MLIRAVDAKQANVVVIINAVEPDIVRSTQTDKRSSDENRHSCSVAPQNGMSQMYSVPSLKHTNFCSVNIIDYS